MYWTDLEIDRTVPLEHLRDALGDAFGVPSDKVAVVTGNQPADSLAQIPSDVRIAVNWWPQPGDFPIHLMLILYGGDLDAQVATPEQTIARLSWLCRRLGLNGLTGTEELGDETWLLLRQSGDIVPVTVDSDLLDEGRFVITQEPAATGTPRAG